MQRMHLVPYLMQEHCVTPGDILNPGDHCRVTEIHSTLLLVEPILTESRKA